MPKLKHPPKLNKRQLVFIDRYVLHRNGSLAAREAGYSASNASNTASELLHRPAYRHVQVEVERRLAEVSEATQGLQRSVWARLAAIVEGDIGRLYDEAGNLKPLQDMDPEDRAMIAEINRRDYQGGTSLRVKLHNVLEACHQIAKLTGMLDGPKEPDLAESMESARQTLAEKLGVILNEREVDHASS